MLRTFNCGVGMIAITDPAAADAVIAALESNGESALRLGEVVAVTDDAPRVAYEGRLNLAG
jgi:phosphoribosylformylglycinamidine cyclo-ligase